MIDYTQRIINQLNDIYKTLSDTRIAILKAPPGMGKTYAVYMFLKTYVSENIINLTKYSGESLSYQSILDVHPEIKYKSNVPLDNIKEYFIRIIQRGLKTVILIDNYENFHEEKAFLIDLIKFLLYGNLNPVFFIIVDNGTDFNSLSELSTFTCITRYISVPQWLPEELTDLFYQVYDTDMDHIPLTAILIIAKRAFGNVLDFFDLIEHIKSRQLLVFKDNQWTCGDISPEVLALKMRDMVLARYKSLDYTLQATLKQAAIIGNEFDASLLNSVFDIEQAYILLNEIEHRTALVRENLNISDYFEFRTCETWLTIKSEIDSERNYAWNSALAHFFTQSSLLHAPHSYAYCECLKKAALYYKECKNYLKMQAIYYRMLPSLINLELYQQALDTIDILTNMKSELIWPLRCNEAILLEYKLLCCKHLSLFESAWDTLRELELLFKITSKKRCVYIQYEKAYLLYQIGKVNEAYTAIHSIYLKNRDKKADTRKLQILHFNIVSLLASVEETLGLDKYVNHYNYSLALAQKYHLEKQYYSQLRKANMAHTGTEALRLLCTAKNYYCNRNQLEYGMTLHNIGTLKLFSQKYKTADNELLHAAEIFKQKGFNGIVYTQNSIAIYHALTEDDYQSGIDILTEALQYMEDSFVKLALLNNISSFQRKLNNIAACEENIRKIEAILSKNTEYPYFKAMLLLQKGLSAKKAQNLEIALNYFVKYIENNYFDYIVFQIFAIKNIKMLSEQLKQNIPDTVKAYINAEDPLADVLVEKNLIYCDLEFWE